MDFYFSNILYMVVKSAIPTIGVTGLAKSWDDGWLKVNFRYTEHQFGDLVS